MELSQEKKTSCFVFTAALLAEAAPKIVALNIENYPETMASSPWEIIEGAAMAKP